MSARRSISGGAGPTSASASGARPILKLRFAQPAGPATPEFAELIDRIDRLETRQSRRT